MTPDEAKLFHQAMQSEYGIFGYKPSPTQLAFHQSNANNRLLTTGGRGGKTTAAIAELAWLAMGCHPYKKNHDRPLSILILSLTRQNASQVVQRKLFETSELPGPLGSKPFIPENELMPGEHTPLRVGFPTYYRVKLRNGTLIEFAWSDDPKSWLKVQGSKRDLIYVDEAHCDRKLFLELQKRLSDARSQAHRGDGPPWLGSYIWGATATEESDSFDDFRVRCEDPAQYPDHAMFHLNPNETGAVDVAVSNRLAAMMTDDERDIHIYGTASASSVMRVYPQFREERHVLPLDYEPTARDNLWLGYDPGWNHPTGMVVVAITEQRPGVKMVVRCWKHQRQTIDYDIACLEHYLRGRRLCGVVYDYNANNGTKQGQGITALEELKGKMLAKEMYPIAGFFRSKKRNITGIPLVALHLDPDHYDKTMAPRIVLNPSKESGCHLMVEEFYKYKGRPATKFVGPQGVIKKWDDLLDPTKYLCAERACSVWNPDWACGATTQTAEDMGTPTSLMPELAPLPSAHELELQRSKDLRTRYGRSSLADRAKRLGIRYGAILA